MVSSEVSGESQAPTLPLIDLADAPAPESPPAAAGFLRKLLGLRRLASGKATRDARSSERVRRASLTAASAALGKAISMASILISVPLTLHHLGPERYGLWMTISSLLVLLSFTDLGLGVGLMNSIAHADGRDDSDVAGCYVSSAFYLLLGIASLGLLVLAASYPFVPWARLLGVTSPEATAEAGPAIFAFIACIAVGLPLSVVQRVQLGYQEGGLSNLWTCVGSVLGLLALLAAVSLKAGLTWIIIATTGVPLLAQLLNSFIYFGVQRPTLRPRLGLVEVDQAQRLIKLGIKFFILQLCYIFSYGLDNFIITGTLGAEHVAQYSVCVKYFSLALSVVHLANSALWTAYGEAYARGDMDWLRAAFLRSLTGSALVAAGFTLVLILVNRWALRLWVGADMVPGLSLLCGVGAWGVVDTARVASSTFLNSINVVRFQVVAFFLLTCIGTLVKVFGVVQFGLPGLAWGGVLCLVPMVIPMVQHALGKISRTSRV